MSGQSGQWVYRFAEGRAEMKNLLRGKGANLAEMSRVGLPVPPGFTITTAACNAYYERDRQIWPELAQQIEENLASLEEETGRRFGGDKPLLVSVRSGAVISMPGMMDTILNLGLTPKTVEALAAESSDRRFAMDCYRRFIQMFANVVLKVESYHFENILTEKRNARNVRTDAELQAEDLAEVVEEFLKVVRRETGTDFPFDPKEQLFLAVKAVFDSWHTPRATVYRQINRIPDDLGTAVNVQTMVFGNLNQNSGTGVAFTRSPSTGEPVLYGEYLLNAQGEDVVAGIRTPHPIAEMERELPEIYKQFVEVCRKLEAHYRDMQDIEFTIENGKLYMLQTRNASAPPLPSKWPDSQGVSKDEARG